MSSFMTIKKSAGRLTQVAARRIACYSTEVPTPNTASTGSATPGAFDISAFIGRIQAIHNNQASKTSSNIDFSKIKAPKKSKGSASDRSTEASSEQPKKFNKNFNKNRNNNGQQRRSDRPAKREAQPAAERANAEVKSAITDSNAEKVDLHVSSQGSRLFNNDVNNDSRSRAPRKQFTKKPFQKYDNNKNTNFNRAPNGNNVKFQAKGRFSRGNNRNNNNRRDRNSGKDAKAKAPVSTNLTPEEALLAVRRQVSVKGSTINVASVCESTLSAFTPGIGYSGESRILRAIQQAQKATSDELRSVVESTCQGKLDGYMIPNSAKANGQESIIPVLNNNPALKPEIKNLFLNLASGKTHISSLRK